MGLLLSYKRTLAMLLLFAMGFAFVLSDARLQTWQALLPLFEWMETTPFGVIGKTWGAAFAGVEAVHLLAMSVLGGAVIVGDGRLLGLFFTDHPLQEVQAQCQRMLVWSLAIVIFTGVFMACGVALKVYYLQVFWYKMLALLIGVLFTFGIRKPLVARYENVSTLALRLTAVTSVLVWVSVAATGRWIGFSG